MIDVLLYIVAGICFIVGVIYLILKLTNWYGFQAGMAPMLLGVFFMGSIQLFFIGRFTIFTHNVFSPTFLFHFHYNSAL